MCLTWWQGEWQITVHINRTQRFIQSNRIESNLSARILYQQKYSQCLTENCNKQQCSRINGIYHSWAPFHLNHSLICTAFRIECKQREKQRARQRDKVFTGTFKFHAPRIRVYYNRLFSIWTNYNGNKSIWPHGAEPAMVYTHFVYTWYRRSFTPILAIGCRSGFFRVPARSFCFRFSYR